MTDPIFIKQFEPILTPCLIIDPLPINVSCPTETFPLIVTLVDTWTLFPIMQSCSINEKLLIIQLEPIEEFGPIITLLKIIDASDISLYLEIVEVGDIMHGNL